MQALRYPGHGAGMRVVAQRARSIMPAVFCHAHKTRSQYVCRRAEDLVLGVEQGGGAAACVVEPHHKMVKMSERLHAYVCDFYLSVPPIPANPPSPDKKKSNPHRYHFPPSHRYKHGFVKTNVDFAISYLGTIGQVRWATAQVKLILAAIKNLRLAWLPVRSV